jgi:indole-3-acetate monooxygenase
MIPAPAAVPASSASTHPLLAVAHELAPRVAARSDELEAARRLPPELARELAQAGFFRMFLPEAYGGLELHTPHAMVAPPRLETVGSVLLGLETDTTTL